MIQEPGRKERRERKERKGRERSAKKGRGQCCNLEHTSGPGSTGTGRVVAVWCRKTSVLSTRRRTLGAREVERRKCEVDISIITLGNYILDNSGERYDLTLCLSMRKRSSESV